MEYASNGKANAALTTGIIGTSLGAIASAGGIGAILGVGKPHSDSDRPVTRYEMELIQANNAKENGNRTAEITAVHRPCHGRSTGTDWAAGNVECGAGK